MLSILRRFSTSSIRLTEPRTRPLPPLGSWDSDGERIVDFFGAKIAFPDWNSEIEEEIREQLSHLKGLNAVGLAEAARSMIVEYLERDNPRFHPHANCQEALRAVSAHTWKVLRAKGMVCER